MCNLAKLVLTSYVFLCLLSYLTGKIIEGETHHITCPGYECTRLVPVELIENLVSREMARRYLQFDIKVGLVLSSCVLI